MIRRRSARQSANFSLFPFLAVLVCTMGALIVLLVMVVQQARVHAENLTTRQEQSDQRRVEQEDQEWRRDILARQREELTSQMAAKRLELSHLEDHIRRLEERGKLLARLARDFKSTGHVSRQELQQLERQRDQLDAALAQAQSDLEQAKKELAQAPPSYAIVPYRGESGTHRRPIYIECLAEKIVVHPGGVELTARDLDGPMGPGNPLDAVLRAIREAWARAGAVQAGEPYPLLVVRPNGTRAYLAARNALKAWDDEFGYELVEQEMKIQFPPADPSLVKQLQEVIRVARKRQQLLMAAMPAKFSSSRVSGLVAGRQGGFTPQSPRGPGGSGIGRGHRRGGFGQGTDERFQRGVADGNARRPLGSEPPEDQGSSPHRRAGQPGGAAAMGSARPGKAPQMGNGHQVSLGGGAPSGPPLARQRGGDWALPKRSANATAYTRPIRVVCAADRLTILPDPGSSARAAAIPIDASVRSSVDQFVSAIWRHMENWGIANAGGYWKPIVRVEVMPGAEARFQELQTLMQGSGIDIERRAQ